MSGNSGGSSPSINRPQRGEDCRSIFITTHLASPQAAVLATLSSGDVLLLELASDQGPLQAFTADGQLAGNILSREQSRLIRCILEGVNYQAEVLEIDGAECQIQISAR